MLTFVLVRGEGSDLEQEDWYDVLEHADGGYCIQMHDFRTSQLFPTIEAAEAAAADGKCVWTQHPRPAVTEAMKREIDAMIAAGVEDWHMRLYAYGYGQDGSFRSKLEFHAAVSYGCSRDPGNPMAALVAAINSLTGNAA